MYIISIIYIVKIEICFCTVISSILKKVSSYPYKFKDHIYIPGKTKTDENTYYCKYLAGKWGGVGIIENGGKNPNRTGYKYDCEYNITKFGEYRKSYINSLFHKNQNNIQNTPLCQVDAGKHLTNKIADNLFDTKEHLENWKYNVFNIKLPLVLTIILTIGGSNSISSYMPWLVDKQYTDDEINKLFNFNTDEIKFIDYVIKKYERYSLWNKRYITGDITITDSEIKNSLI